MKTLICLAFIAVEAVSLISGQLLCNRKHLEFLDHQTAFDAKCYVDNCPNVNQVIVRNLGFLQVCPSPYNVCCNETAPVTTTPAPVTKPSCGYGMLRVGPRIAGGRDSAQCTWPWMVSIGGTVGNADRHICSGVLISPNKTLTTRRCFESLVNITASSHFVMVGENDLTKNKTVDVFQEKVTFDRARVARRHAEKNIDNDMVVITMDRSINPNLCVLPACLANNATTFMEDTPCFIAGWGNKNTTKLKSARARPLERPICEIVSDLLQFRETIDNSTFCARPEIPEVDACGEGDHGGMLMCLDTGGVYRLKGLISRTSCGLNNASSCDKKAPVSVYSDVAYAYDWINTNL